MDHIVHRVAKSPIRLSNFHFLLKTKFTLSNRLLKLTGGCVSKVNFLGERGLSTT